MKRNPSNFTRKTYDVVIIGGGINGAFVAWDAALRGLRVALVEKDDFGGATSSASSKVIHGGIRFLQKGDFARMRESVKERKVFMRIAPHIVHPVPFLIPTYGHFMRGKEILAAGMSVYDLVGFGTNTLDDPEKYIPGFKILSRQKMLELEPDVWQKGLTGGVLYYDCHMHSSERMTLAVILSAVEAGAEVANYCEVTGFLENASRVQGVKVKDRLNGNTFEIGAEIIVNASGPWAYYLFGKLSRVPQRRIVGLSKGIHLVTRPITHHGALALATKHKNDTLINRGGRHFFMIPWRGRTLIGTTNVPYRGAPGRLRATEKDIAGFLKEINEVYPAAALKREDVTFAFAGFYPLANNVKKDVYQGGGKEYVFNHAKIDSIEGIVSVIGTKYTTARHLAEKAVNLVVKKLGRKAPKATTATTPLVGGNIENFTSYLNAESYLNQGDLSYDIIHELILNYGSQYKLLLNYLVKNKELGARIIPEQPAIKAAIIHAVREESAVKLSDIIFRRTGLGTLGFPGETCLNTCATLMASELHWDKKRIKQEITEVEALYTIPE